MFYLQPKAYESDDPLNASDMITVPTGIWETLYAGHVSDVPVFVEIGANIGMGSVGRIQPSDMDVDSMRVPDWVIDRIMIEPDMWMELKATEIPVAHTIYLRSRREATIMESDDPVGMLTASLSGESGGPSWACLNLGAELALDCGVFDVIDIHDEYGVSLQCGMILDVDVNLEIVPAVDAKPPPAPVRPPTPIPIEEPILQPQAIPLRGRNGFVPFSGTGHRLCDPPPPGHSVK